MEKSKNWMNNMLFGVFLAIGVVLAALVIAGALRTIKMSNQYVTVKGYAEKEIKSDLAIWESEVAVTSSDMVSAYNLLQTQLAQVILFFEKNGYSEAKLKVSPVSTVKLFKTNEKGWQSNQVEGYRLSQIITIEDKNIDKVAELSSNSSELLKEGIEFVSFQPRYLYTKINDLKVEMLSNASKDAKERAEVLAKNSGGEIGSIKAASQGVFQITPKNSTDISDYGMNDMFSIEKVIKAVVTVDYYIK